MSKPQPTKILVVRLGAIGDVVNALVFGAAIKATWPGVQLHWAVHPLAAPLVQGNPLVDRVHVWQRGKGLGEFKRLVNELREQRFDLAVDLQRLLKSSLLARLSRAGRVLGYDAKRAKECSWLLTTERISAGSPRAHMVEQYLEFAAHLGLPNAAPRHVLPEDPISEAWADGMLAELGGTPILINLGASKPANRWPAERFGQLAARLSERQEHPICLLGGPGDVDDGELAKQAAGSARRVRNLAGETSLRMLIALSRRARLFIGCDTGPMHIAVATGCPVIALFGPADEQRTGPYGHLDSVVRSATPCAACSAKKSSKQGHTCMLDLSVEAVLSMLEKHSSMA